MQGYSELDSRTQDLANNGELPRLVKNPSAYLIERNDGLRTTLLMLNGALQDFTFAARLEGGQILSTQFFLPPTPNVTYSACLVAQIEEMILTGKGTLPRRAHPDHQRDARSLARFQGSKIIDVLRPRISRFSIALRAESRFGGHPLCHRARQSPRPRSNDAAAGL